MKMKNVEKIMEQVQVFASAWTLLLPGFGEVRWVDVSAFQAAPMQPSKNEA